MAQVTTVRVVRRRSVQPEQYGNASAEVELVANLYEDDDYKAVARALLIDSRALVYENLNLKLPKDMQSSAVEVESKTETATVDTKGSDVPDASESDKEPATKKRGRPRGSKNTAPKKDSRAAKEPAKEPAKGKGSDIPDDEVPNIRANPEDRKNPADDIPDESGDDARVEYTAKDLHTDLLKSVEDKKISIQQAKSFLATFKVARAQDLNPEQVAEGRKMLADLLKTKNG